MLTIVVGSYAVLFTSLAAHAAQFAFLLWFENPRACLRLSGSFTLMSDIERTYGGAKKPLASRIPLSRVELSSYETVTSNAVSTHTDGPNGVDDVQTPGITEGKLRSSLC